MSRRRSLAVTLTAVAVGAVLPAVAAVPARADTVVVYQGQVTRQDVRSQPGSETDTVVEPHVAVSPANANIAIAAAHDSRFPDGGAVGISSAWTADGGRTWHHRAVPGITTATGGSYQRASDPVIAFAADGTAYLSVLLFDDTTCRTAVAVLRSPDGGQTWSKPSYAHRSGSCDYSDDKNWIVVDTGSTSPHRGRIYQFWTPFRYNGNTYLGAPQAVRWSDDKGATWSTTRYVTAIDHGTQNSQPMILPDGAIVDTYYDYGKGQRTPDLAPGGAPEVRRGEQRHVAPAAAPATTIDATGTIYAATSTDGGRTWSPQVEVANNAGGYADGVRCCLFSATIDPVTHVLHAAWEGGVGDTDPVYTAFSSDGVQWSSPVRVSRGDVPGVQRVNVAVAARGGRVWVAYGTRTKPGDHGGYVQQQVSASGNGGYSFGGPVSVGPVSVLRYAAQAGGYFPGDYMGLVATPGRLLGVWAVSSKPPATSSSPYRQVIYGATLRV